MLPSKDDLVTRVRRGMPDAEQVGIDLVMALRDHGLAAADLAAAVLNAASGDALRQVSCAIALSRPVGAMAILSNAMQEKRGQDQITMMHHLRACDREGARPYLLGAVESGDEAEAAAAIDLLAEAATGETVIDLLSAAKKRGLQERAQASIGRAEEARLSWHDGR